MPVMGDAAKEAVADPKGDAKAPDAAALAKELETTRAAMQVLLDKQTGYEKEKSDAKAAEDKKASDAKQAEKDAAAKGGETGKLLDIERAEKADLAKKAADLGPKAARAEKLEAAIKAEAEGYEKKITPEQLAGIAHITDPADRLPILKVLAGTKPAPAAPAAPVVVGQPGAAGQTFDRAKFDAATPADRQVMVASMTPAQLAANFDLRRPSGLFGTA